MVTNIKDLSQSVIHKNKNGVEQNEERKVSFVDWVSAGNQLADVFTKRNAKTDHIVTVVTEGNLYLKLDSEEPE